MKTTHHTRFNSVSTLLKAWVLLSFLSVSQSFWMPSVWGQASSEAESPEVKEVNIVFEGVQNVSEEAVLAHVRMRRGMAYSQTLVDQSIRSLYQTGNFEFIEVRRKTLDDGSLSINFVVVSKYRIAQIIFNGNDSVSDRRLKKEIESEQGLPLDEVLVKRDETKIFELYQKKGYTNVSITYNIERDEDLGTGNIVFNIDEGERLKVDNIRFVGNENIKSGKLRDVMETSEYIWVWSWISGTGRKKEEEFQDDLEALRDFYKDKGYLDVEILQSEVVIEYPKPGWMDLTIKVDEGRQYYVGNISLEGNSLFTTEEIMGVVDVSTGDVFSPSKIDANVENIKDYYGAVGYLDTFVRVERSPNLESGNIDLRFVISESERFYVESITLQGNTKTKSNVIVRELALAPGDTFDLVRMKTSQARLQNTRYFEDVNLSPEATNIPGRRNLRVTVKEGRTGNLTFGAGFSSVEQIVAFAEVSQSNFDLFNYRSKFQGAGQKFRFRFSVGTRSNSVLLSFEEPWVYQRRLAFGFELFHTESEFNSSDYDELRTGFEVYFRKRLFELVEGRLSYRLENVEIDDVDPSAPLSIQQEEGSRSVSKVGLTLLRDTRNTFLFPTRGSRLQSISEVAGGPFFGQTDYIRQEFRASKWFLLHEFGEQTLEISGRIGTIIPYDDDRVPFFDRYFLGGPYTLRGFDFRDVGPREPGSDEPVGGNSMGMANVEYTFRVVEPLRLAAFYDFGFVNADDSDFSTEDYNDNWGVGLRILLLGAPLNLDFGFPLTTDSFNDDGLQFNFSFKSTY